MIGLQLDVAHGLQLESQRAYEWVFMACTAGIVLGIILAVLVSTWIIRSIRITARHGSATGIPRCRHTGGAG